MIDPVPLPEKSPDLKIGAVVVGGDYQGLGIVRSLGRRGVPVCVVDDEFSISRFSRYCTHFVRARDLRNERPIVEVLLRTAERLGLFGWVLYPTREELVAAFSRCHSELSMVFRVPTPEWSSVEWAWNKHKTYELARELGIPTAATCYPEREEQLAALDGVAPPFVIKPAIKEHFIYATHVKAWRADSHAELRTLYRKAAELLGPGEVMVQELIPGGGEQQVAFCAFIRNGEAIGRMTVRRRRQHPLQFGRASTYVETIELPVLEDCSTRFLRASHYYGLVEMEYKLDARDNRYKLLDVNARTWGYHSLGPAAGVDFSYMLYADQTGLPVDRCTARTGVGWVRLVTDLPAAFMGLIEGDDSWRGYLHSLRNCRVEAVFSRDDPVPGVAEVFLVPYLAIKRGF